MKVHTSEQVNQLIAALEDETDDSGKKITPITYQESYLEKYAELMARDKPVIHVTKQTDIITISGRIWPLEDFLASLGFTKISNEMILTASAAAENAGFDAAMADGKLLASTYGWEIVDA